MRSRVRETKLTPAWFMRVRDLSRKTSKEAVRLCGLIQVTTAEGFMRLLQRRRDAIVGLATLRDGTHPLKEAHIALEAGLDRLTGDKPSEYWDEARDLFIDAATALSTYLVIMGFDDVGNVSPQLREAEDIIVLGRRPVSELKPSRPGPCACDMSHYQVGKDI